MLVSAIGYFNSNSKSLYGVEQNKLQAKNLNEGFGHFNEFVAVANNNNSKIGNNLSSSFKTFFTPKADESKKYLNLIA